MVPDESRANVLVKLSPVWVEEPSMPEIGSLSQFCDGVQRAHQEQVHYGKVQDNHNRCALHCKCTRTTSTEPQDLGGDQPGNKLPDLFLVRHSNCMSFTASEQAQEGRETPQQ